VALNKGTIYIDIEKSTTAGFWGMPWLGAPKLIMGGGQSVMEMMFQFSDEATSRLITTLSLTVQMGSSMQSRLPLQLLF
jgi:hypothetical protein